MSDRSSSLYEKVSKITDLEKDFPELFRQQEFVNLKKRRGEWKNIVKYIVLLYKKSSDLIQDHPDLKDRKSAAAIGAGFRIGADGKFPEIVIDLMDLADRDVFEAIFVYLKIQNSDLWTNICITHQELLEFQKLRLMSIDIKKKKKKKSADSNADDEDEYEESQNASKTIYEAASRKDELMEACNTRIKYLQNMYKEFFGDNKSEMDDSPYAEMIVPENADRIMAGTRPWEEV